MSIISRLTTWSIGQVLKAADLNGEFSNITNLLNNLDAATSRWTNVDATTYKKIGTTALMPMQLVSVTQTTQTTTTSSTYASTSLTTSITPISTSSKIFIYVTGTLGNSTTTTNDNSTSVTVFNGSNNLANAQGFVSYDESTITLASNNIPVGMFWVDSPASVAAQTYTVKIKNGDNSTTVRWNNATGTTSMYLLEVL